MPLHGYLATLPAGGRGALLATGSRVAYAPGQTILALDDDSGDVVVVLSGLTKAVARLPSGRQLVLALRGPGDITGELANINGGRRSAAVVAVTPVEALAVRRDDFKRFLARFPAAAESLHRVVVDRLYEADRDRLAAASMTVGQRLARLLLKVVRRYGSPAPGGGLTVEPLSQEELAACVGGGERSVARQVALWRSRNIVSTDRRSITVYDLPALERAAGRHAPPP